MTYFENKILQGDSLEILKTLPDESIDCVVTSPPYFALRDYGVAGQLGLESTPTEYINRLCDMFDEVKRVLKKEGTCWVNLGDTYGGTKTGNTETRKNPDLVTDTFKKDFGVNKCLLQIPSRFAIDMCDRGWILRNEIIWWKRNAMPQSATDRFTVDFEKMFFFTKSEKYYFKQQLDPVICTNDIRADKKRSEYGGKWNGVEKPETFGSPRARVKTQKAFVKINLEGKNKRCVWDVPTKPYEEAHFAVFPEKLVETPIKAGCPEGGIVLDIFMGSGTTAFVAKQLGMKYVGCELNPEYIKIAEQRLVQDYLF